MPDNIKQYESPIDKLQPSETGAETLARMGRIEKENYDEAGNVYGKVAKEAGSQVDNWEYMHEVSQGSAALAVMHNNMATDWNKKLQSTDANDMSIQQKFMDQSQDDLNKWQDGFQTKRGQEWAMSQADSMNNHLWEKTSADMGSRAGNAIINNAKTTVNNLSETARKDPTTIDQALGHIDALMTAQKESANGYLNEAELNRINDASADMKNEVVKSGLWGLADANPQAAMKAADHNAFTQYLKPGETEALKKYSESIVRMQREDQNQAYINQERMQKKTDEAAADKVLTTMFPENGPPRIPDNVFTQIGHMTGPDGEHITSQTKVATMKFVKELQNDMKPENADSPTVSENFSRIDPNSANPLTPLDLIHQGAEGKITLAQYNFFNERLKDDQDTKDEAGLISRTKSEWTSNILQPVFGQKNSPIAEQKLTDFEGWFIPAYRSASADPSLNGLSKAQKAQVLLSPSSPKYMLKPEVMQQFIPTPQQRLMDTTNSLRGITTPSPNAAPAQQAPPVKPNGKVIKYDIIDGKLVPKSE